MKIERVQISYKLRFLTPFHFGTGLRHGLIQRGVSRDHNNLLYLPGSTLKGIVRERCEQIAALFELETLATHSQEIKAFTPNPTIIGRIFGSHLNGSKLYFDDASLTENQREWFLEQNQLKDSGRHQFLTWQTEKRTQVSLSRATGTAENQRLYNSEFGINNLLFEGNIQGLLPGIPLDSDKPGTYALLLLLAALKSMDLDAMGSNKSTGAGQIQVESLQVHIDKTELDLEDFLGHLDQLEYFEMERAETDMVINVGGAK